MLTANQFHKKSGVQIEFQEFLGRMKDTFGDNFMDKVNDGKVKLQEVQKALGLQVTGGEKAPKKPQATTKATPKASARAKVQARRMVKPQKVAATGTSGLKCSSCEASKNATGKKKGSNAFRNVVLIAGIGAAVYWAMKNRK